MIGPFKALGAIRAGAAGLALGLSIGGGLYLKGRVDGWDRRQAAIDAAWVEDLRAMQAGFLTDLQRNTQDGDRARGEIAGVGRTIGDLKDEIATLADRLDCPSDTRVGVRADAARDAAAAAIDRAAGSRGDDRAAGRGSADAPAAGDPPGE